MKLRDKYTLGEIISEGEVKTYAARELGSGANVLVHCLGTAKVDLMTLVVRHLRAAPLGASSGVLDMFESEGDVYLVTEALLGFSNLRTWLESEASSSAGPMTGSVPLQQERPRPEAPAEKPREREPSPPHVPPSAQPGEFTQLFQPSRGDEFVGVEFSAPHSPANHTEQDSRKPGEFTQLFQPSAGDSFVPPESPPAGLERPAERGEAGEFTRILQRTVDRGPQESLRVSSLNSEPSPIEVSGPVPEPGFRTLFGPGAHEHQPPGAADQSGTAIFSAPSSLLAKSPDVAEPGGTPAPELGIQPMRPAPPAQPSSGAIVQPPPALKPPQQPSLPKASYQPPPPPSVPSVPAPLKPPMPKPPRSPIAPKLKPPSTAKLSAVPQGSAGQKLGPSTLELVLILGGLLLVVVAIVLLLR